MTSARVKAVSTKKMKFTLEEAFSHLKKIKAFANSSKIALKSRERERERERERVEFIHISEWEKTVSVSVRLRAFNILPKC